MRGYLAGLEMIRLVYVYMNSLELPILKEVDKV